MNIDLRKKKVDETKVVVGIPNTIKSKVVLVLDISASMSGLYSNGTVDAIIERILPIAMSLDDDGKLDIYTFSDKCSYYGEVGVGDLGGLGKDIKESFLMGGTKYAPPIREMATQFSKPGFLDRARGKFSTPAYVVFITDGDNTDHQDATKAIKKASGEPVFFQFVGIGDADFSFLKELDTMEGRVIDNANFFAANDITKLSDDELYKKLLKEYPSWILAAKDKNLIA